MFLLNVTPSIAQDEPVTRTSGLSASFQESQLDIIIPFWMGQKVIFAPAIGVVYVEDGGKDIGLGVVLRLYTRMTRISPYLGGRIAALIYDPEGQESITDMLYGILYGGEFFLVPQFSIGIEAQLNFIQSNKKSSRFGNPGGLNVNTATAVIANVYF